MKQKLYTSYSLTKAWTLIVLILMFLSVSLLNQTPFIKDLTHQPSAEALLEGNAFTLIKKTYKIVSPEQLYFILSAIIEAKETTLKQVIKNHSDHFYSIERIHCKYSNIPPPFFA